MPTAASSPTNASAPATELPRQFAYQILNSFDKSFRLFNRFTTGAQQRFEQQKWAQAQRANKDRIAIYEQSVADAVMEIYEQVNPRVQTEQFWIQAKTEFALLLQQHPQFELAETFYNSVLGKLFKHTHINNALMFVQPSQCHLSGGQRSKVVNSFDTTGTVHQMHQAIFNIYRFKSPFKNLEANLAQMDAALRTRLNPQQLSTVHTVELLKPVFYRGKAAYLVGRICMPDETLPFVIALLTTKKGELVVDALLTERHHLSVIFSFSRSYFMADTQYPSEVVAFLQELLPHKKDFELYMSLGFFKHGKTVFYRNYLNHLAQSQDNFALAPGIKGLVMAVFHLPSYGVVFKVIKDEFAESKKITREHVKECYKLVKVTDRVGRMADTHEYVNYRLPKERVEPELLAYLQDTCASSISLTDTELVISHLYIERKMTPLNLYLQQESDPVKIRNVIDELGRCIKQIALANIFPGDMLHKNFGVTKTGRVIFYDYDEICYMHQRNFRALPSSDDPYAIDTLSVGPDDVFPQQFEHFIVGKKEFKDILKELHGDLMTPEYWQEVQRLTAQGGVGNFTPYPESCRFINARRALKDKS